MTVFGAKSNMWNDILKRKITTNNVLSQKGQPSCHRCCEGEWGDPVSGKWATLHRATGYMLYLSEESFAVLGNRLQLLPLYLLAFTVET